VATIIWAGSASGWNGNGGNGGHGSPGHQPIGMCHHTGSKTNPFVFIHPDASGVYNGHAGVSHQYGDDIIPAFSFVDSHGNTVSFPGQNLDTLYNGVKGDDLLANGCKPTPSPTPTPTPTPTKTGPVYIIKVAEDAGAHQIPVPSNLFVFDVTCDGTTVKVVYNNPDSSPQFARRCSLGSTVTVTEEVPSGWMVLNPNPVVLQMIDCKKGVTAAFKDQEIPPPPTSGPPGPPGPPGAPGQPGSPGTPGGHHHKPKKHHPHVVQMKVKLQFFNQDPQPLAQVSEGAKYGCRIVGPRTKLHGLTHWRVQCRHATVLSGWRWYINGHRVRNEHWTYTSHHGRQLNSWLFDHQAWRYPRIYGHYTIMAVGKVRVR
jgi:hypothetical protein